MPDRVFREQDLVFFGATTAGVSHELNNVMTIINESAGLLHDFALAAERGRPLDPQRVKKTSLDIARNVQRAVSIIQRLNRFAHSADDAMREVDLNHLVLDVAALAGRVAEFRGLDIQCHVPDAPVLARTYAFGLHRAVVQLLRAAAVQGTASEPIHLSLEPGAAGAEIRVAPVAACAARQASAAWGEADELARDIDAEILCDEPSRTAVLRLSVASPAAVEP